MNYLSRRMIKKEEIKKLANLSRIEIEDKELDSINKDLSLILDYVSQVKEAGSKPGGLVPTQENVNQMRDDKDPHPPRLFTEDLIELAPKTEDNYIKVKKIIDLDI